MEVDVSTYQRLDAIYPGTDEPLWYQLLQPACKTGESVGPVARMDKHQQIKDIDLSLASVHFTATAKVPGPEPGMFRVLCFCAPAWKRPQPGDDADEPMVP